MSFRSNMARMMGTDCSVGEYLLNKISHVALLTLLFYSLTPLALDALDHLGWYRSSPALWHLALGAAVAYTVIGKLIWLARHKTFDPKDALFDLWLVLIVPASIWGRDEPLYAAAGAVLWLTLIVLMSRARWGKPS